MAASISTQEGRLRILGEFHWRVINHYAVTHPFASTSGLEVKASAYGSWHLGFKPRMWHVAVIMWKPIKDKQKIHYVGYS